MRAVENIIANAGWTSMQQTKLLNFALPVLAVLCAVMPLEISHLAFALMGAIAFSVIQSMQPKKKKSPKQAVSKVATVADSIDASQRKVVLGHDRPRKIAPATPNWKHSNVRERQPLVKDREEVRKPSSMPILAPTFVAESWDSQINELLGQITPTIEDDKIVAQLARVVKKTISHLVPEVEVVGFASGDLKRNKAFGVAVPEVDIIANVNPDVLEKRLRSRMGSKALDVRSTPGDVHKLRKSAIRAFTDNLVSEGGFKFRRSAFRNEEPKVTLLAPSNLGICDNAIPLDFSVNAINPLHNAALMMECSQMDPRAKELILLVKRWAKDRGVCHAAKGHLSPYCWSLLCIFFLQAGLDDGALLPALDGFKKASALRSQSGKTKDADSGLIATSDKTSAMLFKEFMKFYSTVFDWRNEAISIRVGKRGKPSLKLPLHIIVREEGGETKVGPSIEDPFDEAVNLATGMGCVSVTRLQEELSRAHNLCVGAASLAALLEPWAPEVEAEQQIAA